MLEGSDLLGTLWEFFGNFELPIEIIQCMMNNDKNISKATLTQLNPGFDRILKWLLGMILSENFMLNVPHWKKIIITASPIPVEKEDAMGELMNSIVFVSPIGKEKLAMRKVSPLKYDSSLVAVRQMIALTFFCHTYFP